MTVKRVGLYYIDAASTIGCVCPGDTLTYECTVRGLGATVWRGTAFECSSTTNELILLHRRFTSVYGASSSCNNGDTVARGVSAKGNNYTSQLNVTITPDTAGKTVECLRDNGTSSTLLFSRVIPTVTGLYFISKLVKHLIITHHYRLIFTTKYTWDQEC